VARTIGFLLLVALGVAGALALISDRRRATAAGYRIAQLERERLNLIEDNRRLAEQVARYKTPGHLFDRAKEFELGIKPPEERLKEQLKEQKAQEQSAQGQQRGRRR